MAKMMCIKDDATKQEEAYRAMSEDVYDLV